MKYCVNCGQELEESFRFCTNCQAEQPMSEKEDITQQVATQEPEEIVVQEPLTVPSQPMRKRTKVIIAIIVTLLILAVGTHVALSAYFNPKQELQRMDEAVTDGDQKAFTDGIDFDKQALLNKKAYFSYIEDNEWDTAKAQIESYIEEKRTLSEKIMTKDGNVLYTIKPRKHVLGLYRTYSLLAEPASAAIETPFDGTQIAIEDKKEQINQAKSLKVKAYPGAYKFRADATTLYGDFKQEETLDVVQDDVNEIELEFPSVNYTFDTDQPEAILMLNGKSTNRQLKEFEEIGPFPKNSNATIHAEWKNHDGKVLKTAKRPINNVEDNHLTFIFDDALLTEGLPQDKIDTETAALTVQDFRNDYEIALNSRDYSYIANYMLSGSTAEKEIKDYVGELKSTDFNFYFQANDVEHIKKVNDYVAKVTTREQFEFTDDAGKITDYDRLKVYTVKMTGEDYKISDIGYVDTKRDGD